MDALSLIYGLILSLISNMNKSKIISSACKLNDKIWTGFRHSDCFAKMRLDGMTLEDKKNIIQGFMDEDGNFLTRREAFERAVLCGQVKDEGEAPENRILVSEDVWPPKRK